MTKKRKDFIQAQQEFPVGSLVYFNCLWTIRDIFTPPSASTTFQFPEKKSILVLGWIEGDFFQLEPKTKNPAYYSLIFLYQRRLFSAWISDDEFHNLKKIG